MPRGPQTRATILDHALREASLRGLEALSIGGLARQTGLSKSGLFAHFDSKQNLQVAVLEAAAARFADEVVRPALVEPRGLPRMRALMERWLAWSTRELPGGCVFLATAAEFDDRPGAVRDALVRSQEDWLETLTRAASIAVEEGQLAPDLACRWVSLLVAHGYFSRLLRDPGSERRTRAAFEELLRANAAEDPR